MTLQDKKTHLLDNDNAQNDVSDTLDIFDQYGSGGDDFSTTSSASTAQSVTRPRADNVAESSSQEVEKKWEQEYEEESPRQKTQPEVPVQSIENVVESQQKEFETVTVSRPKKDVPATPSQKKVEMPETPTPQPEEVTVEEVISPKQETVPIAAPVKQNYNSVVQGHQKQKQVQKKSMRPKEDNPLREVHIDPSKKTIMIVDDDIDTLEMYADVFENADYNVIRAADGLEAMSLITEHTPHVIFTGIVMPRMDGFSMMEALKQNKRTADIPVVINSHLGRDTDKDKAEELGARDFIIRGFTQPREVVERIGALLLKSDYVFRFDKNDRDVRKLAKDLGAPNFFRCPRGQEMVLKLSVVDEKELAFSARFSCIDSKDDKK